MAETFAGVGWRPQAAEAGAAVVGAAAGCQPVAASPTCFARQAIGQTFGTVGVALRCTRCGATSVSSLFYLGPDAHVCRVCNAPFELADARRDRRAGADRRRRGNERDGWAEWRSGLDRRQAV